MWAIELPNGQYLESVPALNFERNNQVFSSGDTSVLPGSFSFPFEVEMTNRNKELLGNPQLVNNADNFRRWETKTVRQGALFKASNGKSFQTYDGVWVLLDGARLFTGTLTIKRADNQKASLDLVINPLQKIRDSELGDLALGGDRELPTPITDHMLDTSNFPSAYDYAFFPVPIDDRHEPDLQLNYHNYYDTGTGSYHEGSYALTPFVRLDYLINQIFSLEENGYSFQNKWQIPLELKRLYVSNNRDIRTGDESTEPDVPETFRLNDFVPKMKSVDCLKAVIALFNLGLFINPFSRTISLASLEALLARQTKHDWSQYAINDGVIEGQDEAPDFFSYEDDPETIPPGWPRPEDCTYYETDLKFITEMDSSFVGQYFYIEEQCGMYYVRSFVSTGSFKGTGVRCHRPVRLVDDYRKVNLYRLQNYVPVYRARNMGAVSRWVPGVDAGTWDFDYNEVTDLGLIMFRGMTLFDVVRYPNTSPGVWDRFLLPIERLPIVEDETSEETSVTSLHWDGEYGIYNKWHATWNNMLRSGKPTTQSFELPISVFLEYSFEDKIRSGSMDFFIKRLRVQKATGKGMLLVEAQMLSVI